VGVDPPYRRHDLFRLTFDVAFPSMPCHALHVDTLDASGEASSDARGGQHGRAGAGGGTKGAARAGEVHKIRLGPDGAPIRAPEYVAPSHDHLRAGGFVLAAPAVDGPSLDAAFDQNEGCQVRGWLAVQRVAGSLRFTPHLEDYMATRAARSQLAGALQAELARAGAEGFGKMMLPHVLRLTPDFHRLNMSHAVHHLSFGPATRSSPPNPLDGAVRGGPETGTWRYFARVVPVDDRTAHPPTRTAAYSLGEHFAPLKPAAPLMPSVSLLYDVAPLAVTLAPDAPPFHVALVRWVAVAGGVRAVAAFVDRAAHAFF
jgi:hypothetical protein